MISESTHVEEFLRKDLLEMISTDSDQIAHI